MNLRGLLKSLDGYSEEKFNILFGKFEQLGLRKEDDNHFCQRIYQHIHNQIENKKPQRYAIPAQNIYLLLDAVYSSLKQSLDNELKDTKLQNSALVRMNKAMELLDVCQYRFQSFFALSDAEAGHAEVDFRDLLLKLNDETKPINKSDFSSIAAKRIKESGIVIESAGIYVLKQGEEQFSGTMRSMILSVDNSVNFEAIYLYMKFISNLTYRFERIFDIYIISPFKKKYAVLFENINEQYIAANLEKVVDIFSNSTQLLDAILNEETIKTAFRKVPINKWRSILPDRELFPLVVFHDQQKNENISQIWRAGDPYTLQSAILIYLNSGSPAQASLDRILNIILELPFHFGLDFIIQFIGTNFSEKQGEYYTAIFDKYIKKYDSQLAWLEELDFPVADKVLDAIKLTKIEVEYNILYTSSEKLKGTRALEEYAKSLSVVQDKDQTALNLVDEVKLEEVSESDFTEEREEIINNNYNSRSIVARHIVILNKYRDKNFTQNENKELVAKDMSVLRERIEAYKKLMSVLKTGPDDEKNPRSFDWSGFIKLYNNKDFRTEAGNITFKMNWTTLLSQYIYHPIHAAAHPLWSYVDNINKDREKRLNFFKKFQNPKFITSILSDANCLAALQPEDFGLIFENCFDARDNKTLRNRIIFFKMLDRMHRSGNSWAPFKVNGVHVDPDVVAIVVSSDANIDAKNRLLKKLAIMVDAAQEMHSPNTNNNESLPKHLSYQMQESDISVAEQFLFNKYRRIFINNVVSEEEKKEEQKSEA